MSLEHSPLTYVALVAVLLLASCKGTTTSVCDPIDPMCGDGGGPPESIVSSVDVSPAADTLIAFGETTQFTATAWDANGGELSGRTFTWTSSDVTVASVGSMTGLVTAVANGDVDISATTDGVDGRAPLGVHQAVATVSVTPTGAILTSVGETLQFDAEALDPNSNVVADLLFLWLSSDHNVATVDETGLATAVGQGTVTVSAAARGMPGTAFMTVSQDITDVSVSPAAVTLTALTATTSLTGVALDANGNVVPGTTLSWTSSDEGVVTVGASGDVTALSNGMATITATAGSFDATVDITVAQQASARLSTVTASPNTVADDVSEALIRVTLRDVESFPIAGTDVLLSVTGAGTTLTQADGPTDAIGEARGSLRSNAFGDKTITVTATPGPNEVVLVGEPVVAFGASRLEFTVQPTDATSGSDSFATEVTFMDAADNIVTSAADPVTIDVDPNALFGRVHGTTTVDPVAGVATFDDYGVDHPQGYTLRASAGGLDAMSDGFTVFARGLSTGTTLAATVSNCDDCTETVPLGFIFNFYGTDYTTINVSSNGNAQFTTASTDKTNQAIPTAGGADGFLAPFWDDLYTSDVAGAGDIYYRTIGTAPNRGFIVEWRSVSYCCDTANGVASFEMQLVETSNEVRFTYGEITSTSVGRETGSSATIGIENLDGTDGAQAGFNTSGVVRRGTVMTFRFLNGKYVRVR